MSLTRSLGSVVLPAVVAIAAVVAAFMLFVSDWRFEAQEPIVPANEVLRFLDATSGTSREAAAPLRLDWLERHTQALTVLVQAAARAAEASTPAPLDAFRRGDLEPLLPLLADPALKEARPPVRLRDALATMITFAAAPSDAASRLPDSPPGKTLPTPGVIESTIIQGWMAVGAGRFDLAARLFESQRDTGPGDAPAQIGLAFLSLIDGQPGVARAHLQAATGPLISGDDWSLFSLNELRAEHHRLVAQSILPAGMTQPALVHLEQAVTLTEEARAFTFLHRDHWVLVLLYHRQGAKADAARHAFRAFVYAKTMRNAWGVGERFDHLSRAMLLAGEPSKSIDAHREILGLTNRTDATAAERLAQAGTLALAFAQADRGDEAIDTLVEALKEAANGKDRGASVPALAQAREHAAMVLGWLLLEQGRAEDVWLALRPRGSEGLGDPDGVTASADPVSAMMLLSLRGWAAQVLGRSEDACDAFSQAVAVLTVPGLPDRVVYGLEKAALEPDRAQACAR